MAKTNPRRTNGAKRRSVVARLRARHDPCAICGQPIDYSLPAGHPLCFECDEIIPVSKGGSPYDIKNVQAAHRICNQKRQNKSMEELIAQGGVGGTTKDGKRYAKIANDLTLPLSRAW